MKKVWIGIMAAVAALALSGCGSSDSDKTKVGMKYLAAQVESGSTAENASARILVVDTRSSSDYIQGHIRDALNVPYAMIVSDGKPLYTNGYDAISTTASDKLADSWLAHMLINQLVNDFISTYEDSTLVFYGENGCKAKDAAIAVGYENAVCLDATYDAWESAHPDLTAEYGPGVESVDRENHSFVFTGFINNTNYANVSSRATHHGITYKGGCLSASSFLQADLPPFCFQEIMTYIGISSAGNMADGIVYGDMSEWGSKFTNGEQVLFEVTWDGADRYYTLGELMTEKASEFDTHPEDFSAAGMEPRVGGTRESNLNWNPGCIYCNYACVCGITSNAKANEDTWFADGGIYDVINLPEDERNYYAGRYYPEKDTLPGEGRPIKIRVSKINELK